MNEVLRPAAYLPQAIVRLPPSRREVLQYNRPQRSAALGLRHARLERLKPYVSDLAKHVELQLLGCVIANAHRRGVFIAGQPTENLFRQPALTAHAVHDLDLARAAGDSPKKPIPPCPRFLIVSEVHKGHQREGGVSQPAIRSEERR